MVCGSAGGEGGRRRRRGAVVGGGVSVNVGVCGSGLGVLVCWSWYCFQKVLCGGGCVSGGVGKGGGFVGLVLCLVLWRKGV